MAEDFEYVDKDDKPLLWYVEWLDHSVSTQQTWKDWDDNGPTPCVIHSVGWILFEDEDSIVVTPTLCIEDGFVGTEMCIIKSCVVKAVKLKDPLNWKEHVNDLERVEE